MVIQRLPFIPDSRVILGDICAEFQALSDLVNGHLHEDMHPFRLVIELSYGIGGRGDGVSRKLESIVHDVLCRDLGHFHMLQLFLCKLTGCMGIIRAPDYVLMPGLYLSDPVLVLNPSRIAVIELRYVADERFQRGTRIV